MWIDTGKLVQASELSHLGLVKVPQERGQHPSVSSLGPRKTWARLMVSALGSPPAPGRAGHSRDRTLGALFTRGSMSPGHSGCWGQRAEDSVRPGVAVAEGCGCGPQGHQRRRPLPVPSLQRDVPAPRAGPKTAALLAFCRRLELPGSGTLAWLPAAFWG